MQWSVYILICADGTFYTGITTNLERRLSEHNGPGSTTKYTRVRQPCRLAYTEAGFTQSDALRREAALKRLSRAEKANLCARGSRQNSI